MSAVHPVVKRAASLFPATGNMAQQQADQWEALVSTIAALPPGDGLAETLLRQLAALHQSITVNYSPIHGWTLSQHWLIHREANRLLGANQEILCAPGWTEQF